jgi:Homeodomain
MASPVTSDELNPMTGVSGPMTPGASTNAQPSTPTNTSSGARRPPRKSTLTQQQKNQKRQRATQDQLVTLEVEFEKNPTPTAIVRERIAQEINMTERSVQIWFQNRRAKIKNMVKKSIENGEDSNDIPDSMRRYLAMQAMETGKPLGRDFMIPRFGSGGMGLSAFDNPSNKVGKFTLRFLFLYILLTSPSHSPFHLPLLDRRQLEKNWPERHGPRHILLT